MVTTILDINKKMETIKIKNNKFFKGYDEVLLRNHELERKCREYERLIARMGK